MGMETLSWARLGADVTGLDFSRPALDKAELLRDELGL
jgi:2-polyprenyl-3-methyl-5-hydroxy-6-metoxy-1,4-benzoquinol methylase